MDDTYSIVENIEGCNGFAVIDEDGDLKGCFNDKAGAERFIQAKQQDDMNDDMLDDNTFEMMSKADSYTPTDAMAAAARRALKYREDGKAKGAGTAVGWTRANQLANKEPLSLDTVKRMYSFFSRHEVDKQGKDWDNTTNPSNGRIMWLAWGGDAGYSWSRAIVERENKKSQKVWDGTAFQIRKA